MQGVKKAWHKVNGYFQSLDAMGAVPEISVTRSSSYKTRLGAFLTILCTTVVLLSAYTNISKVFDRSHPSVLCTREFDIAGFTFDILKEGLLPTVAMYNKFSGQVMMTSDIEKYATFRADYWTSYYNYTQRKIIQSPLSLEVKPCISLQNRDPYNWLFTSDNFKDQVLIMLCIEVPKSVSRLVISGSRISVGISSVRLHAYPCSLSDSTKCKMTSDFEKVAFVTISQRKYSKFSDFNNPVKSVPHLREDINIVPSLHNSMLSFVKGTRILDNRNWVMPSQSSPFEYLDLDTEEVNPSVRTPATYCSPQDIDDGSCSSYFVREIRSSGKYDECTRTYVEVLSAISEVGGAKELLFVIVSTLYAWYNLRFYHKYLRNGFYSENEVNAYILGSDKSTPAIKIQSAEEDIKKRQITRKSTSKTLKNRLSMVFPSADTDKLSEMRHLNLKQEPSKEDDKIPKIRLASTTFSPHKQPHVFNFASSSATRQKQLNKAMSYFKKNGMEIFSDLLSVESLILELGSWKVFKEIVFGKHHKKLLPLVLIELERRERDLSQEDEEKPVVEMFEKNVANSKNPSFRHDGLAKRVGYFVKETIDFHEAIAHLNQSLQQDHPGSAEEAANTLDRRIDAYFLANLPDFLWQQPPSPKHFHPIADAPHHGSHLHMRIMRNSLLQHSNLLGSQLELKTPANQN